MNPKLTLNYGVRLEHESGLREENNQFTVAFDQALNPGGQLGNVVNPTTGQRIVGGLVYAGQNGANEYQGDPPAIKFSPRVGLVYAMNPKISRACRLWNVLVAMELPGAEQCELRSDWRSPSDLHQSGCSSIRRRP